MFASPISPRVAHLTRSEVLDKASTPGYDPQRTARFFLFGLGMGPLIGRWNKFLQVTFPLKKSPLQPSIHMSALAKRVLSDQICM